MQADNEKFNLVYEVYHGCYTAKPKYRHHPPAFVPGGEMALENKEHR